MGYCPFSKEGYSGCAIATKLKISVCGVQAILRKALTTGTVKDRDRSGRLPSREDRLLYCLSLSNRRATSRMLKRDLEDATGAQVSTKTVRRRLVKAGSTGCGSKEAPSYINSQEETYRLVS